MHKCRVYDWDESGSHKYVVVFSRYQGKLLLSRHRSRTTWETQGGHIEPGESPTDAARRELWEESGAFDTLPGDITYPGITPFLYQRVRERFER